MTRDEVLTIHTEIFYDALKGQKYAALEELYSDDYMLVRPDGSVLNKQEAETFWSPGYTGCPKGYIDYPEFSRS